MTSNRSVSEMVERTLLDDVEHFLCGIDDATADGLLTRLAEARASSQAQSDDVVERVARAICVQDTVGNALDAVTPTEREHYYKLARAAIAAIPPAGEEPTDAMIEAGCEAMHKVHAAMRDRNLSDEPETMDDFDEGDVCRAVYHAMRRVAATPSAIGGGDGR